MFSRYRWCIACPEQSRSAERLFRRNSAWPSHRNLVRFRIDHDGVWPRAGRLDGATQVMASRLFPQCSHCAGNGLDHPDEDSKSRDESQRGATRFAWSTSSDNRLELRHLWVIGVVESENSISPLWSHWPAFAGALCFG